MKLTDKQFNIELGEQNFKRSTLKRWKRAFYLKERTERPVDYMFRLLIENERIKTIFK